MMCFGVKNRKRVKTNHCVIVLLDDTQLVHELQANSTGQDLLDVVIKHLNLLETSYFGLRYLVANSTNGNSSKPLTGIGSSKATSANGNNNGNTYSQQTTTGEPVWLDVSKNALKQLKDVNPMTVYLGVKYYASDPCKLAEEITRYQFFLQCKQDILHSRLPVPFELAVELFALAVQSELGDYDPQRHLDNYVSEFQFLAPPQQSLELEKRVALMHRNLTGQMPATAEMNFLERVKWLDLYGCELHPIQYEDNGDEYALGLNPSGVLVLRNRLRVAQYLWPRIVKTKCQGRCFLMDVIDNSSNSNNNNLATTNNGSNSQPVSRNRFGFRLASKEASQKLRWSIEEHKSFQRLIHDSSSMLTRTRQQHLQQQHQLQLQIQQQQQHQQQQQQVKLSQKFRNSIRSAIGISGGQPGGLQMLRSGGGAHLAEFGPNDLQLRSSMKSLASNKQHHNQNHQQFALEHSMEQRAPPTVFRVPSRRYGNRSLRGMPFNLQANGNGLPVLAQSGAMTLANSQRQHAVMMINQFNQLNGSLANLGKSQTLKATSKSSQQHHNQNHTLSSKESKQRKSYNQMLMMMAAANQQPPEMSILLPGRHIVQPSVYKASSIVNGMNQLGAPASGQQDVVLRNNPSKGNQANSAIMQLFNTKPQYPGYHANLNGHESPRSTKSAIATGSALKMASKKLMKQQQQQLLYGNNHRQVNEQQQLKPLLTYLPSNDGQPTATNDDYNQMLLYQSADLYNQHQHQQMLASNYAMMHDSKSANHSPRSVRSARITSGQRHKSKSTGENLHLLHHEQQQQLNNKMLLATTHQLMAQQLQQQQLPPPDYYTGESRPANRLISGLSDDESELSKLTKRSLHRNHQKRAAFALDSNEANLLLNGTGGNNPINQNKGTKIVPDEDYYCSRSDCSSVDTSGNLKRNYANRAANSRERQDLIADNNQFNKRPTQQRQTNQPSSLLNEQSAEWTAIRRRHNEFSSGKGYLAGSGAPVDSDDHNNNSHLQSNNNNNNSSNSAQLLKNIANKQATPILLSMTNGSNNNTKQIGNANSKAVQMLNLQRQQLNSQSSADSTGSKNVSANSSLTPSPHSIMRNNTNEQQSSGGQKIAKTFDSAASGSTTSGYYAGSNSTGSASPNSDSHTDAKQESPAGFGVGKKYMIGSRPNAALSKFDEWPEVERRDSGADEEGSRAKIALGQYTVRASGGFSRQQQQQSYNNSMQRAQQRHRPEAVVENRENQSPSNNQQWSSMNQNSSASLKYVSFDV